MKHRTIQQIEADLAESKALLHDLQTIGDKACSAYDLSFGYNAEFYLGSHMIENHIRYFEEELKASQPRQQSLF
jgi:hypothetical protein